MLRRQSRDAIPKRMAYYLHNFNGDHKYIKSAREKRVIHHPQATPEVRHSLDKTACKGWHVVLIKAENLSRNSWQLLRASCVAHRTLQTRKTGSQQCNTRLIGYFLKLYLTITIYLILYHCYRKNISTVDVKGVILKNILLVLNKEGTTYSVVYE